MNVLTFPSQNVGKPQAQAFAVQAIENNNFEYTQNSPFTVDMTDVLSTIDSISLPTDSTLIATKKFKCIYDKLTQSPKFKDLFLDVFGTTNNINAKFKIVPSLPSNTITGEEANATTKLESHTVDSAGNINSAKILIKINKKILTNSMNFSNIEIARTIIHECIHAFLMLKRIDCTVGITIDEINNFDFPEIIENYYDGTCQPLSEQHNFMINYMIPTMQIILDQIKDSLIPQNQQNSIQTTDFYSASDPDCPLTSSKPFTWQDFYKYLSLNGLQRTQAYNLLSPADKYLTARYRSTANSLDKNCN